MVAWLNWMILKRSFLTTFCESLSLCTGRLMLDERASFWWIKGWKVAICVCDLKVSESTFAPEGISLCHLQGSGNTLLDPWQTAPIMSCLNWIYPVISPPIYSGTLWLSGCHASSFLNFFSEGTSATVFWCLQTKFVLLMVTKIITNL